MEFDGESVGALVDRGVDFVGGLGGDVVGVGVSIDEGDLGAGGLERVAGGEQGGGGSGEVVGVEEEVDVVEVASADLLVGCEEEVAAFEGEEAEAGILQRGGDEAQVVEDPAVARGRFEEAGLGPISPVWRQLGCAGVERGCGSRCDGVRGGQGGEGVEVCGLYRRLQPLCREGARGEGLEQQASCRAGHRWAPRAQVRA